MDEKASSVFTVDLAYSLKDSGVDILELGVPFSDPVAEGPIIEKANLLALKNGFKINDLFYFVILDFLSSFTFAKIQSSIWIIK